MSYIRSGSNPEGLYIFGSVQGIEIMTGRGWQYSNVGPEQPAMIVPYEAFKAVCGQYRDTYWTEEPIECDGFKVVEETIWEDTGELVTTSFEERMGNWLNGDERNSLTLLKVTYGDRYCYVWRVTWDYVCRGFEESERCSQLLGELESLQRSFIECRDAFAEAMNWHDNSEDPDNLSMSIPFDRHESLMKRLDTATVIADKAAEELADTEDVEEDVG